MFDGEPSDDLLFFEHVKARLPNYRFEVIFDVGANIGQSCIPFSQAAPDARIYAFEPVKLTYEALLEKTAGIASISAYNLAFGDSIGVVSMQAKGTSKSNRILEGTTLAHKGLPVPISTGEAFVDENRIDAISFLKIDTEGHDLAVLRGFGDKVRNVDFIQVETSMNSSNQRHVPFNAFLDFFAARDFYMFYMYDQTFEFHDRGRPWVRRANPVFVRSSIAPPLST